MNYLCKSNWVWRSILLISLQFFCITAYSQDMVVKGIVMNEQNARISNAEIKLGTANVKSNSKGIFILHTGKLPAQINVKHPSYKDYVEVVRAPLRATDTMRLEIILEGKETALEEVTINASKIIWAYDKKNTHIIDFALYDKEILLVCVENHKYFLRRLDSIGKKIVDLEIKKNPVGLYGDCTGGTHLVYTDSIFEIKFIRNSIGMLSGNSYAETMRILGPCVISSADKIILKRLGPHNKLIEYMTVDWNTKKPDLLYTSRDQEAMRGLDEFAMANNIPVPLSNPNYKLPPQMTGSSDRAKWDNQQFYNQILKKPLYIPIFEINDSLYIFDHLTDKALVYTSSGQYIRSYQINYHYFENWKNQLFLNEEKTKLYAKYEIDGLVTLRQINPSTGKVLSLDILEKHIHPINIQIRGSYAYYIYKHYLDNSIHYLYKQPLKE